MSSTLKLTNAWAKIKNGMTTETYNNLRKADRVPTGRAGRQYDENRAKAYMEWLTGRFVAKAVWSDDKTRVCAVIMADGNRQEIPNWDWVGTVTDLSNVEDIADYQLAFAA